MPDFAKKISAYGREHRSRGTALHYWRVPFDEDQPVERQDAVTLDFKTHRISSI
jgi:hypothetical protein